MIDAKHIYQSNSFAKAWHEHQTKSGDVLRSELMNPILSDAIGSLTNLSVLDAGCGNGFYIGHLLTKAPRLLAAVDISKFLIKVAKDRFSRIAFTVSDIETIPFKSSTFDAVICYNVLMDLLDVESAIQELWRVTNKLGIVHIIIVHPIYNLFVNDKEAKAETLNERLQRYTREEPIHVNTILDFDNFIVYRRPISYYLNVFSNSGFFLERTLEIPITDDIVINHPNLFESKANFPVFVYFKLRKSSFKEIVL